MHSADDKFNPWSTFKPLYFVEEDDLTQTDACERGKVKYVEHLTVPHLEGATEARRLSGCNVGR